MKTVAATYKYKPPVDETIAIREKLKDTKRELKEAMDFIERLALVAADSRYRRLQRFELIEQEIATFLYGEDEDEDDE
jgi:hypothetical protein